MDAKIKVIDSEDKEIEIEQIADIHLDSTDKDYLVYTKNEEAGEGIKIYISEISETDEGVKLLSVDDDKVLDEIKTEIAAIVRGINNDRTS